MPKTLLATFTSSTFSATKAEPMTASRTKKLKHLMQELQPHLDHAANDLLQPRAKAVDSLLQQALMLDQSQ